MADLPDVSTWKPLPAEYDPLQLLSPNDLAGLFGIDRSTARRWMMGYQDETRRIPPVLPGFYIGPNRPRVKRADVHQYVENQRSQMGR
jgi:hypothetical protein